jgi:hypothetical protein
MQMKILEINHYLVYHAPIYVDIKDETNSKLNEKKWNNRENNILKKVA